MQPIRGNTLPLSSGPVPGGGHLVGAGAPIVGGGGTSNAGLGSSASGGTITGTGSRSNNGVAFSISEALDVIRREYDSVAGQVVGMQTERLELEAKLESQLVELNAVRRALFDLESQHTRTKQQYEDELLRLRSELNSIRHGHLEGPPMGSGAVTVAGRSNSSGPAAVGNGLSPATSTSIGAPAAMRPSPDQHHHSNYGVQPMPRDRKPSDRDHDMDWERERERTREPQRERERGRERERADSGVGGGLRLAPLKDETLDERDASRLADNRDPKRHKARRDNQGSGTTPEYLPSTTSFLNTAARRPILPMALSSSSSTTMEEFSFHTVSPESRKEGLDWCAVYNPKTRKALDVSLVHTFPHTTVVCCVQFSADGKFLATGCNRTAQIFDVHTGEKVCVVADETASAVGDLYIRSVRFSPDGKFLATGAEDRKIRIWEIATRRIRHVFAGHEQEIYSLDFSPDGRYIVSGSGDRTMRIWDLTDPAAHRTITIADSDAGAKPLAPNDAGVTSVAISPDGRWVAAGSLDYIIRIWDLRTGELVERLKGHEDSVYSVAFTPDGMGLLSGSLDKAVKFWDIAHVINGEGEGVASTNTEVKSFVGHKDFVLSVAVSNDGRWVISGSKDRTVHVWDARTAMVQFMLQGHKNSVISIDINPHGNTFATGSGDHSARIWSIAPI
ncbi:hypothetical protein CVT24_007438 [Panaeolus cyanescens]|uniref:Transcriptional repressor Tup1 N-terminal domain-containing protein n=1 Tax=Panaeolus cyanescens TaxID=181874 RepID=A0A409W9T8_9AGAR|nr:hypothetical protein CVT24_007438 [Panaeolus cyanescens]